MTASNSAFVSYRRDPGYASAKLIWTGLREADIDAFLDLESMSEAGNFDAKILNQISGRPYFVIVLTDGTLDRCRNPGDWLWRELEFAVTQGRIIVPAMIPPFDIADADQFLPSPAVADTLKRSNGVTFPPAFFDAAVQQLVGRLRPTELTLRAFSPDDRDFARRAANEVEGRSDERHQSSWTRRRVMLVIAACAVLLGVVGLLLVAGRDEPRGSADSTSPTSPPPSSSNTTTASISTAPESANAQLFPDEVLEPGQQLTSANGRHVLAMTVEGRLVASTDGREWWSHPNPGYIGAVARMQNDGNLVVYKSSSSTAPEDSLWASQTQRFPGATLRVEDVEGRGMIAIYAQDGERVFKAVDQPASVTTKPTQPDTTTPVELTVPSMSGLSGNDATAQLEGEPYSLAVTVSTEPNEDVPVGLVIRTNPPEGTSIGVGDPIEIVISAGQVTVPDVKHLTEAEARQILADAGLDALTSVHDLPAGDPRDGTVIEQSPEAGEPANVGDDVSLRVGRAVVIG